MESTTNHLPSHPHPLHTLQLSEKTTAIKNYTGSHVQKFDVEKKSPTQTPTQPLSSLLEHTQRIKLTKDHPPSHPHQLHQLKLAEKTSAIKNYTGTHALLFVKNLISYAILFISYAPHKPIPILLHLNILITGSLHLIDTRRPFYIVGDSFIGGCDLFIDCWGLIHWQWHNLYSIVGKGGSAAKILFSHHVHLTNNVEVWGEMLSKFHDCCPFIISTKFVCTSQTHPTFCQLIPGSLYISHSYSKPFELWTH